jgi:flagellar basal body-associated protein FliL
MAKKKKEQTGDEEEAKGGKKKKMIIIAVVAVVGLYGAKTMLMKAPSAASVVAATAAKEKALTDLCARQNAPEAGDTKPVATTTTTAAAAAGAAASPVINPLTERGAVLEMDPLTVNLADGHYLKLGIALQLDTATLAVTAKADGLGAKALDMAIAAFSTKTMNQLAEPKVRAQIKHKLGLDACASYEGVVLTVYFTNFVMQ